MVDVGDPLAIHGLFDDDLFCPRQKIEAPHRPERRRASEPEVGRHAESSKRRSRSHVEHLL